VPSAETITDAVTRAAVLTGKTFGPGGAQIVCQEWFAAFQDMDDGTFNVAIADTLATVQRFPLPGDIRKVHNERTMARPEREVWEGQTAIEGPASKKEIQVSRIKDIMDAYHGRRTEHPQWYLDAVAARGAGFNGRMPFLDRPSPATPRPQST